MKYNIITHGLKITMGRFIYACRWVSERTEGVWLMAALCSVALLFLESGAPDIFQRTGIHFLSFQGIEYLFTVIFTLEYVLRLVSSDRPLRYIISFFGIIDLVTLLPLYILWLWPEMTVEYLTAMRLLRVLRLLRLVKVLRYIDSVSLLWETLYYARQKLLLFLGGVMIMVCLSGGMMYVIEGPEHGFTTLPVSVYWAVVTMTTVGYGDITPHTLPGRLLASLLILTGYSLIAIPTGVMSAYMTEMLQHRRRQQYCRECHNYDHSVDARFCQRCGAQLGSTADNHKK